MPSISTKPDTLESLITPLERTIREQRDRIADLQAQLANSTSARRMSDDALIAATDRARDLEDRLEKASTVTQKMIDEVADKRCAQRIAELQAKNQHLQEQVQRWQGNFYAATNGKPVLDKELTY